MSDVKIGQLIDENAQRDAIHVAIAPVVAGQDLLPGDRVSLKDVDNMIAHKNNLKPLGIVDPFLSDHVREGQRFYMFLFPGTVTSLRHHWTHPAFLTEPEHKAANKEFSEIWLRAYAAKMNSYDDPETAFNGLIHGLRTGEILAHGTDLHGLYELQDSDELKEHAEKYLGIPINWGMFTFSCSC